MITIDLASNENNKNTRFLPESDCFDADTKRPGKG
jgi:hypothetical protein